MTFNLTQRSSWESEPRYSPPARFTKSRVDEYKDIEYDTIWLKSRPVPFACENKFKSGAIQTTLDGIHQRSSLGHILE